MKLPACDVATAVHIYTVVSSKFGFWGNLVTFAAN